MSTATATKPAKPAKKADAAPTEHKYSEAVRALSEVYESGISFAKDGTPTVDESLIEANLPPDITMAQIKRSQRVRGEVVSALALAMWQKGKDVMAANKDLQRIESSFKFGTDKIELGIEREREFNDGSGGKTKKYAHVSVGYTASGATNAGDFKKARAQIAEEGEKLFG